MPVIFADSNSLTHDELEEGAEFAPKFSSDGLVTAVTVDARTGEVLMVAHMNQEALSLTLETGDAHYFSRSRGRLWKKGESSGEVQKLVEMQVDCDQDAVVLKVHQTGRGAACHTGRKSCFFRTVRVKNGSVRLEMTGGEPLFDPKEVYSKD